MVFGRVRKKRMGVTATYTEYINCYGPKDAHKNKRFIVGTDTCEDKCADYEEYAEDGRRSGIDEHLYHTSG